MVSIRTRERVMITNFYMYKVDEESFQEYCKDNEIDIPTNKDIMNYIHNSGLRYEDYWTEDNLVDDCEKVIGDPLDELIDRSYSNDDPKVGINFD